jgi:hypothetical protein
MSSLNFNRDALNPYAHHGDGYGYNESQHPSGPSNTAGNMYPNHYAYSQIDTGIVPFFTSNTSFLPLYVSSTPLHTSPNLPPSFPPQPFLYHHGASSPTFAPNVPAYYHSATPVPPLMQSGTTTTHTIALTPALPSTSTSSTSQGVKSPCPSCGKLCTGLSKTDTCFFTHITVKPFACNGDCGTVGWLVSWLSYLRP